MRIEIRKFNQKHAFCQKSLSPQKQTLKTTKSTSIVLLPAHWGVRGGNVTINVKCVKNHSPLVIPNYVQPRPQHHGPVLVI